MIDEHCRNCDSNCENEKIRLVTTCPPRSEPGSMEGHQADNSQNYITVIPVEYPRSRAYPHQHSDFLVQQYSEYLRDRTREEYMRGDYNINSEQQLDEVGPLYSVSQRYSHEGEWDRPHHPHTDTQSSKDGSTAGTEDTSTHYAAPPIPLKLCVFPMSRVVLHMELEDGVNTTVQELMQAILQEQELGLPKVAASIFTLWMCSGLLELQLKAHHKPHEVRDQWSRLVAQNSSCSQSRRERDEPVLSLQRNVFFPKRDEEKIKDQKLLDLLYEEARYNILEGRYPCEVSHYIMLGGIQARIELGPYEPQKHTTHFFREQQCRFLPAHVSRSTWSWLRISGKNSPEVRLLEQFKRIPTNTPVRKLVRKYLEFCWSLPYYGGAFFQGQVEQPVRGLTSLITHQDVPVLVAVNAQGVYIIDDIQCTLLLGLKYEEMSWDFAKPSQEDNLNCLPCIFIQFMVLENGTRVSKILQVFSKQAVMMDALITVFVEELKQKTASYTDDTDRPIYDTSTDSDGNTQVPLTMVNRRELPQSCLSNKLSKLTLATFDEEVYLLSDFFTEP